MLLHCGLPIMCTQPCNRCEVPFPSIKEDPLSLESAAFIHSAEFEFNSTLRGIDTTVWKWKQSLGPIPLEISYLWVDQSNASSPSPVRIIHDLIADRRGNETIDFTDFTSLVMLMMGWGGDSSDDGLHAHATHTHTHTHTVGSTPPTNTHTHTHTHT